MDWTEVKKRFPVGDIRTWTVKSYRGLISIMDVDSLNVDAFLEVTLTKDEVSFPLELPPIGSRILCIVLGHTPIDKKVRLSARKIDLNRQS